MSTMLFVNLPIDDLARSVSFWTQLGFQFRDDTCTPDVGCLMLNDLVGVMLLENRSFHAFHGTAPARGTEVILTISASGPDEVERLCAGAIQLGATAAGPRQSQPGMVAGAFRDLDGHIWEILWMKPDAAEAS